MRRIRDVLKCMYDQNLSARETARLTGLGRTAVGEYRDRFLQAGLSWPLAPELDDHALEVTLYPLQQPAALADRQDVDFALVHAEKKKKGATLRVLHDEWVALRGEELLSYSRFCALYIEFKKSLKISLRQSYQNGEVAFVDYAGQTVSICDAQTGGVKEAQLFIGVLGGSNYTFCEATWSQKLPDWIDSHVRMFEFFGGTPKVVVHDNLRSAVTRASRTMPITNESYRRLCLHYGTHPFAARAYKPKDKALAEVHVQIVERWIIFVLRRQKFFSLAELNRAIRELLDQLNRKPFQRLPGNRFTAWIESEQAALMPLPNERYQFAEWGKTRAGIDYHVTVDDHSYSVPNQHKGVEFEYRLSTDSLELFIRGRYVVTHTRNFIKGGKTTCESHRTDAHNAIAGWTPTKSLEWADTIGPGAAALTSIQIARLNNHYFGYRTLAAMKRLHREFGALRFEQACQYAAKHRVTQTEDLRRILAGKLDQLLSMDPVAQNNTQKRTDVINHENVRGASYYSKIINEDRGNES